MSVTAERDGARWAARNDSRITKIGKYLRKTHLDEFPQFINVLKGEMTLIGPRPERPEFVKQLNDTIMSYYRRYNIKPGITGLAQVRYHYTSSLKDARNKVRYDLLYLKKRCFFMDSKIFFSTFGTVLFGKGGAR
jgi:lipopolysaccharide/colanic/teichoic acid biosynthesis glycosyltransferase